VVEALELTPKAELPALIGGWLDTLDSSGRLALIKLITAGCASAPRPAGARRAGEWSGTRRGDRGGLARRRARPTCRCSAGWRAGGNGPDPREAPVFRPLMLAHPLEEPMSPRWSRRTGARVEMGRHPRAADGRPGGRRLWSRSGEDVSPTFPEMVEAMDFHAVLDGELLVIRDGEVAPFADLQQRLNRKVVTRAMQERFPVAVRLYDILFDGAEDLRALPLEARRARLEAWFARVRPPRFDLSEVIPFGTLAELEAVRAGARAASIEGLMLKRRDSAYVPGRVKGLWWKWKRAPLSIDAVMMYAQRGHGKRSSFYSDYTFGLWRPTAGGGAGAGRQGLFRLHGPGAGLARPLDPQPHDGPLRPGAGGGEGPWCWR
jgi:DNA ligase-1